MVGERILGRKECWNETVLNALRHLWLVNAVAVWEAKKDICAQRLTASMVGEQVPCVAINNIFQMCSTPYGIYGW